MFLMRRDPLQPLSTYQGLQRDVSRLFDETCAGFPNGETQAWAPAVEIYNTDDELVVVAELPGFEKKEVNISFENGRLSLSGERKAEDQEGRNHHRNERWFGVFERSFQLPTSYATDKIKANLHNGILTVTVPKKAEAKPRQISVSVS